MKGSELISYLVYIEVVGRDNKGRLLARYRCICGKEIVVNKTNVKRLNTKSCGCMRYVAVSIKNSIHGLTRHPLHGIWMNIKRRCYEEKNPAYPRYGGDGIIMCDEWKNDFKSFYDWALANGWKRGLDIDKDIKGGKIYSPDNCLIVTKKQNCNKRKNSHFVVINGESKTISEWADYAGIDQITLHRRLFHSGWSPSDAISKPIQKLGEANKKKILCIETNEVFNSRLEAAKFANCTVGYMSDVCRGKYKKAHGYSFKYIN